MPKQKVQRNYFTYREKKHFPLILQTHTLTQKLIQTGARAHKCMHARTRSAANE